MIALGDKGRGKGGGREVGGPRESVCVRDRELPLWSEHEFAGQDLQVMSKLLFITAGPSR